MEGGCGEGGAVHMRERLDEGATRHERVTEVRKGGLSNCELSAAIEIQREDLTGKLNVLHDSSMDVHVR